MPPALRTMSIKDDTNTLQSPDGSVDAADYWASLIRKNLQRAQSVQVADSESEDEQPSISEEIINAPRRKSAREPLAVQIAARLYPSSNPDSLAPLIKYERDIILLRNLILEQRRTAISKATERNDRINWIKRINR